MNLTDVLNVDRRADEYPTVVTDTGFVIESFNEPAKALFPDIREGRLLTDLISFADIEFIEGLKYPASAVGVYADAEYFCSICPALDGVDMKYVFTIASPEDGDQYLSMKVAAHSRLSAKGTARGRLGESKLESSLRLMAALDADGVSSVNVKSLLEDAFSYFCRLKYGDDEKMRYRIECLSEYVRLSKPIAAALIVGLHVCLLLSSNEYCEVSAGEDCGDTYFRIVFKPNRDLREGMKQNANVFRAFYRALGRQADEFFFLKCLVGGASGKTEVDFDQKDETARLGIVFPCGLPQGLRSHGLDYSAVISAVSCYIVSEEE